MANLFTGLFSVSTKLFLGFFLLIACFWILVMVFITNTYEEVLKQNEITNNLIVSNEIRLQFDFITYLMRNTTTSISGNENVRQLLLEAEQGYELDEHNTYLVEALLNSAMEMHSFIADIHLITTNGTAFSAAAEDTYYAERFKSYIEKTLNGYGIEFWSEEIGYPPTYVIPIFMTNPRRVMGVIALNINYDFLHQHLMSSAIRARERALIVNAAGQIIFNFPFHTSYYPFLEQHPEVLTESNLQKEALVHGIDTLIVTEQIALPNWRIIRLIDLQSVTYETQRLNTILINLLIISLFVGLLYSLWFSRRITTPLRKLVAACERAKLGDLTTQVNIESKDEVGNLGKSFNNMILQLHQSFEQGILNQKKKAEMELQILHAQITPHFLYNTLDSIRWLAVMQNANNIAEMSQALIGLLKYNLASPDTSATLRDELESVHHYVKILRFRFSDNFDYSEMIDPDTVDCSVLRFILQPLVENCILHGFDDMGESYQLRISSFIEGKRLHIKVIDNGSGITPERIKKINSKINNEKSYNHIGVHNIRERIKLSFGDEYNLFYSSQPNVGTIAEVTLPLCYKEKQDKL